jgi:anti-sigma factor (TIGR02949 family)
MSMYEKLMSLLRGGSRDGNADSNGDSGATCSGEPDMISCQEALKVVQEYLDGELDDTSARSVRKHFDVCGRCYPHLNFESAYRDAVCRAMKGETAPPALKAKVSALIADVEAEG